MARRISARDAMLFGSTAIHFAAERIDEFTAWLNEDHKPGDEAPITPPEMLRLLRQAHDRLSPTCKDPPGRSQARMS